MVQSSVLTIIVMMAVICSRAAAWSSKTANIASSTVSRRTTFSILSLLTAGITCGACVSHAVDQNDITLQSCDEECMAKRTKIIQDRRAMMRQSQTTSRRQDMFDLSRQRAALYNTTYQGASCLPDGVPCL